MIDWSSALLILAENGERAPGGGDAFGPLLFPMILIAILWYFLLFRPQRREQVKKEQMLSALKKNDRVITIGGIIGSVANISADGREVTLKVDDNTRIKFLRGSIQGVMKDEAEETIGKTS
jgi:preprotein translocase subunit YajC